MLQIQTATGAPVTVTRGPYLQMATETTMTLRWRTSEANVGRVNYGTTVNNLTLQAD